MSIEGTTVLADDAKSNMWSANPQPKNKPLREDVLRIPSRKKLSSLEAQRISGVMEDCISKVEIVAMLPTMLAHLDNVSSKLNNELIGALREHHLLGERMESLENLKQTSGGGQEGEIRNVTEKERARLERNTQSSVRNVLRVFRAHPTAIHIFKAEVDIENKMRINMLRDLNRHLLDRLLTSPAEERLLRRYMQEASSIHGNNIELIASLESELATAIKHRDTEISKKNYVVKELKSSLHHMKKTSEDLISRMLQDADNKSHSDTKTSEVKQVHLQEEIRHLKVQLNNLVLEDHESNKALRMKKYKVETEIENWIHKYDDDMEEKQDELEKMAMAYEEEKQELTELEEVYAVLELEYSQIQEERQLAEERMMEEKRELELKSQAAIIVQAWWRGYRIRKAIKGKSKRSKKAKGKKGRLTTN